MLRIIIQKLKTLAFFLLMGVNVVAQDHNYSLQECVEIALERNLTIQRGKLDLETSKIDRTQSQWQRVPDLNATSSYGTTFGRSIDPRNNLYVNKTNTIASLGLNSSLTVFNGFQISNSIKQSNVNWEASNLDMEKAKNDVALNIASLYLTAIFNKELVGNAQFQLHSTEEQLARTQKLVDAGALPKTNMLDLRSQVASNEVALINAENNYNIALLNLKQALLIPAGDRFEIVVPEIDPSAIAVESLNPGQIYETAESTMPEVKSADLRIQEAELGYKMSRGAYAPTLSLAASYSTSASSASTENFLDVPVFDPDQTQQTAVGYVGDNSTPANPIATVYVDEPVQIGTESIGGVGWGEQLKEFRSGNVGFSLRIPIFNQMNTRSSVQKSMINRQRAEISAKEIRNQLRQTIEQAYNDLVSASKSYQANQHQVDALEESFRVTENQFNIGAVNFVDYQVANNQLFMAKSDLVRAKYDLIFKQKILDFYLGNPITL